MILLAICSVVCHFSAGIMKLVLLYFAGAVCLPCITVWLHTRHHIKKNLSQLITRSEQVNCMQEKSFQPIRISFERYKTQILNRVRQAKTWNPNFRWLTVHLDYWLVSSWGSRPISRYVVDLWGRGQNQNKATTQSSLPLSRLTCRLVRAGRSEI